MNNLRAWSFTVSITCDGPNLPDRPFLIKVRFWPVFQNYPFLVGTFYAPNIFILFLSQEKHVKKSVGLSFSTFLLLPEPVREDPLKGLTWTSFEAFSSLKKKESAKAVFKKKQNIISDLFLWIYMHLYKSLYGLLVKVQIKRIILDLTGYYPLANIG